LAALCEASKSGKSNSGGYLKDRTQGNGYWVGTDFYVRYQKHQQLHPDRAASLAESKSAGASF